MENERLVKVETHVEWLVKTIAKMEPKLDLIAEKQNFQWGKVIGVALAVEAILGFAIEYLRK